jgi:hypothetical protein
MASPVAVAIHAPAPPPTSPLDHPLPLNVALDNYEGSRGDKRDATVVVFSSQSKWIAHT